MVRRRQNPDDRLRRRMRDLGDDPIAAEAAYYEAVRSGRGEEAVRAMLAMGWERANAIVAPLGLGGARDALVLALGFELVRAGWLPNIPVPEERATARPFGMPVVRVIEGPRKFSVSGGRAKSWKLVASYGLRVLPGTEERQGATFFFVVEAAGRAAPYSARERAREVGVQVPSLRRLAPRGWFLHRWQRTQATTMPQAKGGVGLFAGVDFFYPENPLYHYVQSLPTRPFDLSTGATPESERATFEHLTRLGWLGPEQTPVMGDPPGVWETFLMQPARLEAIRALFYGDLWLAGLLLPPGAAGYDPETMREVRR